MNRTILSLIMAGALGLPSTAGAIDMVLDVDNLITAGQQLSALGDQIKKFDEEIRLIEQQYQDMAKNTVAPLAYTWDQAQQRMNQLRGMVDTVRGIRTRYGSLDAYAKKFQDVNYYRSSPCFGPRGCTEAERERMAGSAAAGSAAQKDANDAMLRGLDRQQDQIEADAKRLEELQALAGSADGKSGRMAALQAANMLASHQAAQILQLRALLVQQQQAEVARAQAAQDRDARQLAEHEAFTRHHWTFPAAPKRW